MGFCCYKWFGILKMGKYVVMYYNFYVCIFYVFLIEIFLYVKCVIDMYIMLKGIYIC